MEVNGINNYDIINKSAFNYKKNRYKLLIQLKIIRKIDIKIIVCLFNIFML